MYIHIHVFNVHKYILYYLNYLFNITSEMQNELRMIFDNFNKVHVIKYANTQSHTPFPQMAHILPHTHSPTLVHMCT